MALQLSGTGISDIDRAILDLERTWWQAGRSKVEQIEERFAFSGTDYYRRLAELVADRAAYAYDPLTVRRVRRDVERRRAARRTRALHGPVLRGLVPHLDPA